MKGPGINDYLRILQQKKQEAHDRGEKWIEISSKELHQEVRRNMRQCRLLSQPTSCYIKVMKSCSVQRDKPVLALTCGFGIMSITWRIGKWCFRRKSAAVRLRVRNRNGGIEWWKAAGIRKICGRILAAWLNERGWQTTEFPNKIQAEKDGITWIIEVQGTHRGRRQPLPVKINAILKEISEDTASSVRYSVASMIRRSIANSGARYRRFLKNKLNVSVILADKSGNIQEVK